VEPALALNDGSPEALEFSVVSINPDPNGFQRLFVEAPEFDAEFEVWGESPVQALGTVLGRDLYFRARHNGWTFDVADHAGHLPSDGFSDSDGFYREGGYPNASWMPHRKAVNIIKQCLQEFTDNGASSRADQQRE
jgi:hypothetical protein